MTYYAMRYILKDKELRDEQCMDTITCWAVKNNLLTYDTGMGKGTVASAVIRGLVNEVPSRRVLFIVANNQFITTPKEVAEDTGLRVETCTGQFEDQYKKLISADMKDYQILFLSYTFFDNIDAVWYLYQNLHLFYCVVIDEMHLVSNFTQASRSFVIRGFIRNIKHKLALTATPATRDSRQFAELLHVLFPEHVTHVDSYAQQLSDGKIKAHEDLEDYVINRNRPVGLLNYKSSVHIVDPMPGQEEAKGPRAPIIIKGPGAENQYLKLREILDNHISVGRPGLVYIRNLEVMSWVYNRLLEDGIKVGYINGDITDLEKRGEVIRQFREGEIDVVLTSITTSIGMESDFLILYQSCPDIVQMLGRGYRTMNPKTIHLDFIFTDRTREVDYFLEKTYTRSVELQQILRKDYSVLINACHKLREGLELRSF